MTDEMLRALIVPAAVGAVTAAIYSARAAPLRRAAKEVCTIPVMNTIAVATALFGVGIVAKIVFWP
jgi:hypothetical protein